jgi:NADH-quinone oxidoreductase subunit M
MILLALILIPLLGGLLAWWAERFGARAVRWIALAATTLQLSVAVALWAMPHAGTWWVDVRAPWVPQLGIGLHLALDGFSLLLVLLTGVIGLLAVAASWDGITVKVGFFHFNLLATLAGITGIFLAFDLFLFYVFWEVMLVPLYFLIDIWGHEDRHAAAKKFFIFTQTAGLFLLLGILGLVFTFHARYGVYTFDYFDLLARPLGLYPWAPWLMLGFFVAFAVKLPAVPFHTWLPDAHTQAPVAGSVDLAGLVLKVGAYGLLRFTLPLFPEVSRAFAPLAMTLAVLGILYGALLAFAQTDMKRLVAYTSVSHMGFALLGIFAWNEMAWLGVTIILLAHGLSTGALFIFVGILNDRVRTRDITRMGGLWARVPKLGGLTLFFVLAALGLPGLGTFVGELLVLQGTFLVQPVFASLAALGFVLASIYALWLLQRVFFGPPAEHIAPRDVNPRELAMLGATIALTLWLGLYPQPLLDTARAGLTQMLETSDGGTP